MKGRSQKTRTDAQTNRLLWFLLLTLFVSRFSDSLSLTGSISQGLCSVQICGELEKRAIIISRDFSNVTRGNEKRVDIKVSHLIYNWLERDLEIVHSCQLHGLIDALRSQRVSPENGVWIPAKRTKKLRIWSENKQILV